MSESVAVLVTVSVVNSAIVRLVCAGRIGGGLTSLTVTVKLLVTLKDCWLTALMLMPVGGEVSEKVRELVGISESVAEAETLSVVSSLIVWLPGTVRTGGTLISLTMSVNVF